jgi:hypothetical protein
MKQSTRGALPAVWAAAFAITCCVPCAAFAQGAQGGNYRTSEWSSWDRKDGVEYRYGWGWNPLDPRYDRDVDAMFQLRNMRSVVWQGAARTLDCTQNIPQGSKALVLQPNATGTVKFVTRNCGTRDRPHFRPDIVASHSID